MAEIILGIGTSHGPMLATPPDKWGGRVAADKQEKHHPFRNGVYDFDQLVALREDEGLADQVTPEMWRKRYDSCQGAIERLAAVYAEHRPDVAVIIGNDQRELFLDDNMPAFTVFWGADIPSRPRTPEQIAALPPGIAVAERGFAPPEDMVLPGLPELGRHIVESLMEEEFDVSQFTVLPKGSGYVNGVPHAFGFVYRRIMHDDVIPNVPVFTNTFYPPNQPTAKRCFKMGRALKRAIDSWGSDKKVVVFGSGGLSHFVIDEELDRTVLAALEAKDFDRLIAIPESLYQSGSSEIKNWIPLAGIMAECDLDMTLVDYVPCYRSLAGTGTAHAFAYWT